MRTSCLYQHYINGAKIKSEPERGRGAAMIRLVRILSLFDTHIILACWKLLADLVADVVGHVDLDILILAQNFILAFQEQAPHIL